MIYLRNEETKEIINIPCEEMAMVELGEFHNFYGELFKIIMIQADESEEEVVCYE